MLDWDAAFSLEEAKVRGVDEGLLVDGIDDSPSVVLYVALRVQITNFVRCGCNDCNVHLFASKE